MVAQPAGSKVRRAEGGGIAAGATPADVLRSISESTRGA